MTTAQVVETSVIVNNNSPIQDYLHPDDQTQPTFEIVCIRLWTTFGTFFYDYMCGLLKGNPEMSFASQETKLRKDSSDGI